MKRRARTGSGSGRLVAVLVVLAMVPLGLLAYTTVRLSTGAVTREVEARIRSSASLSAAALQKEIQGVVDLVESYADRPTLVAALSDPAHYDQTQIQFQLGELASARPGIATTFVADPAGMLIEIVPPTPSIVGQDFTYRDWYHGVTSTGRTYVSSAYMSLATGNPLVVAVATFVRASDDGSTPGRPLGILVAAYGLDEIQGFVDKYASSQGVALTVTDQSGIVVASPGRADILTSRAKDPFVAAALEGKSSVRTVGGHSGRLLAAYEPIPDLGWTVTASVPARVALAGVDDLRGGVLLVAAILALVLAAGLLFLARALRGRALAEEGQAQLAAIVESSDEPIVGITLDGVLTSWNSGAEHLYGYTADEAVGQHISILAPPDRKEEVSRNLERIRQGERIDQFETVRLTKEGTPRDVSITSSFIRDRKGDVVGTSVITRDITDHKRAERRLAAQYAVVAVLAEAQTLAEGTHRILETICSSLGWQFGAMWAVDNARGLLRCVGTWHPPAVDLPEFEALTERTTFPPGTGLPGRVWTSVEPVWIPDVVIDPNFPRAPAASEEGLHAAFAVPILLGEEFLGVMEFFSREIREPDPDLLRLMGTIGSQIGQFIDRKRSEEALREREATLKAVFAASPDMITMVNADGQLGAPSPAVRDVLGYDPQEFARMDRLALIHPDDQKRAMDVLRSLLQGGPPAEFRFRMPHASGRWVVLESRAQGMRDAEGRPSGLVAVSRDVTQKVALEEALRSAKEDAERAKDEAERANRAKSEFLSRMSHELRTPLNAVLGFGQLLEMDNLNEEQRESVGQILKGGRHLLDLINEVLDIARIEVGRIALSLEPVAVDDAVLGVVDLIRPLASEQGIRLGTEVPDSLGYVTADRQRLKQVLLNLLSNAVKYNKPGGSVSVRCGPAAGGQVRVDVIDDGPGIAPEYLSRLFMPFERLGAESSGVEGTGLGLALSKRLVEVMGGTLEADTALGRGSTFSLSLPGVESPEARFERSDAKGLVLAALNGEGTLLHIEDNPANLKLIERILSGLRGVKLLSAMQGTLGLDLARQHRPDVILLDLNLPDMQGQEVLGLLRSDPRTKDIPVLVVSADATPEQLRRLRAAGARAYLTKPLDIQRFLQVVDDALKERRLDHAG